jgi:hypothetical protein
MSSALGLYGAAIQSDSGLIQILNYDESVGFILSLKRGGKELSKSHLQFFAVANIIILYKCIFWESILWNL